MFKAQYTFAGYGMLLGLEEVIPSKTPLSFLNMHVFSAANHIASIIVVFIASLGVVRLTSLAAAKIDTSKQHNSLIPWKLLFSVWSYVSFLSPPHFLLKGRITFYLQLGPGPVVCCFCMQSHRIIL